MPQTEDATDVTGSTDVMDVETLAREAREADAAVAAGRARLVAAVRAAHRSGMSQREIAQAIGRSQPEVSRLIRFHGTSPHARALRAHRDEVIALLAEHGLTDVRVFGSTARGTDGPDSDIDLLVSSPSPVGLLSQSEIEVDLVDRLCTPVDLVIEDDVRPVIRERILKEVVPL